MPAAEIDFAAAAECLRSLGHPARLQLLFLLADHEAPVGELATATQLSPAACSQHLRLLQRCQLLGRRQQGRQVFYHLTEDHLPQMLACLAQRFGLGDQHASAT